MNSRRKSPHRGALHLAKASFSAAFDQPKMRRAEGPHTAQPIELGERQEVSRGPVPAYLRIAQILRMKIASFEFAAGMQLPTEEELTKWFGVSRHTVRAAVALLSAEGLVEKFAGRGTFIAQPSKAQLGWAAKSLEDVLDKSFEGQITVLGMTTIAAAAASDDAIALRIDNSEHVFQLRMVRRRNERPLSFAVITLKSSYARMLPENLVELLEITRLLYLLEQATGLKVDRLHQSVLPIAATAEIADALEIKTGTPIIALRNIYMDKAGSPLETSRIYCHPVNYMHSIEFSNSS